MEIMVCLVVVLPVASVGCGSVDCGVGCGVCSSVGGCVGCC